MKRYGLSIFLALMISCLPFLQMGFGMRPGPELEQRSRASETWTVLAYMNGDNNLESDLLDDLNEMEKAASNDDVRIVVQLDRASGYDARDGNWEDTRRYLVKEDYSETMASQRLDSPPLGELNMDDPVTLREFLVFGLTHYPSDHYMVILEGHASGPAKGIMKDDSSTLGGTKEMEVPDMGAAIREAVDLSGVGMLDVISFDVCWMGMAEAAAEMMDHAHYMVGSFDETPHEGWPYDVCLPLIWDTGMGMSGRLSSVVERFAMAYDLNGTHSFASLAAVDLGSFKAETMPNLARLSMEMFYTCFEKRDQYTSLSSRLDTPRLKSDDSPDRYVDLYQMAEGLALDRSIPPRVRAYASSLLSTEDQVLIAHKGGVAHPPDSRVFGIYFPTTWGFGDSVYASSVLGTLTAWDDFTRLYLSGADLRPERINWTDQMPEYLSFKLRTTTPGAVMDAQVEVRTGGASVNITLTGSGGLFSGSYPTKGSYPDDDQKAFMYRYKVRTSFGGWIQFPPSGYEEVQFISEPQPPEIWHTPPSVLDPADSRDRLLFHIRDQTGVDTASQAGKPRLEYREQGTSSWYSVLMEPISIDRFRGFVVYSAFPEGIEPGKTTEYHAVARDVLGNTARLPVQGEFTTKIGQGERFYLDLLRSNIAGYSSLLDQFSLIGMTVDAVPDGSLSNLSNYKAYILLEPVSAIQQATVDELAGFMGGGGELLLVIDPTDGSQVSGCSKLLTALGSATSAEGRVNGFYPSNAYSEVGIGLPSISGTSTGSFELTGQMSAVYYTEPPLCAMITGWKGKGRMVMSIPALLDDPALERASNRELAQKVAAYLGTNLLPVLDVKVSPSGVVTPSQEVEFDLGGSFDRDGDIVTYALRTSEGSYAEGSDPVIVHSFERAGTYTVDLMVTDAEGGIAERTISIKVNRPPDTTYGVSSTTVHAGELVTFDYKGKDPDGDDLTVVWTFGDGFATGGRTVRHAYRQSGQYQVELKVRDANGLESLAKTTILVENSDPVAGMDKDGIRVNGGPANFSGPSKVTLLLMEGDTVEISSFGTYDPDAEDELQYEWDMGDGSVHRTKDIVHRYLLSGPFRINLTVGDGVGGWGSTGLLVMVENRPPVASFAVRDLGEGRFGFDASSTMDDGWDMDNLTFYWDFGDGERSTTGENYIEHDFTFGGAYTVELIVEDTDGGRSYFESDVKAPGLTLAAWIVIGVIVLIALIASLVVGAVLLRKWMIENDKGLADLVPDAWRSEGRAPSRTGGLKAPPSKGGKGPVVKGFSSMGRPKG